MKISFPIFVNGNGNGNSIPEFGIGNETLLFPGMTGKWEQEREWEWHGKIFVIPLFNASTIPYN